MKMQALLVLSAGLLLAADAVKDATKADKDKLQGAWQIASVEVNGEEAPDEALTGFQLTIQGDKYTVKRGDDLVLEATFKLDATKKPKQLDVTATEGQTKGKTFHSIYTLEDGTLRICRHRDPEEKRPSEFAAPAGSQQMLVVWKKEKP
jgi:uncharacterized protein (TIGR03067 family)